MKKYYIVLDQETGETILDTNYKTFLFTSEKDIMACLSADDELMANYYDGRYQVIEIIL